MNYPAPLLGAALLLSGCAGMATKRYEPPTLALGASRAALLGVVEESVRADGWTVLTASPRLGLVEALTPEEAVVGMRTRERWTFYIQDQALRAELLFEVKFPGADGWKSEAVVCEGYEYLRERARLDEIAERLRRGRQTLAAGATAAGRPMARSR